jgi:hypothetical protein
MVPRVVLHVKRAVRRLARPEETAQTGPQTVASWQRMLARVGRPEGDAEARLAAVERELNRLGRR